MSSFTDEINNINEGVLIVKIRKQDFVLHLTTQPIISIFGETKPLLKPPVAIYLSM